MTADEIERHSASAQSVLATVWVACSSNGTQLAATVAALLVLLVVVAKVEVVLVHETARISRRSSW